MVLHSCHVFSLLRQFIYSSAQCSITLQFTRLKISPGWTDGTTVKCTATLPEEQGSVPNIHSGEALNLLTLQFQGIGHPLVTPVGTACMGT